MFFIVIINSILCYIFMGFLFNKVILDMKVFDYAIDPPSLYCSYSLFLDIFKKIVILNGIYCFWYFSFWFSLCQGNPLYFSQSFLWISKSSFSVSIYKHWYQCSLEVFCIKEALSLFCPKISTEANFRAQCRVKSCHKHLLSKLMHDL